MQKNRTKGRTWSIHPGQLCAYWLNCVLAPFLYILMLASSAALAAPDSNQHSPATLAAHISKPDLLSPPPLSSYYPEHPHQLPKAVYQDVTVAPVTCGVSHHHVQVKTVLGPLNINILQVNLNEPTLEWRVVQAHDRIVSNNETVSSMARRTGALAGINGDYFLIGTTGEPINVTIIDNEVWKSPINLAALAITKDQRILFDKWQWDATISTKDAKRKIDCLNTTSPPADSLAIYTMRYGAPVPPAKNPQACTRMLLRHIRKKKYQAASFLPADTDFPVPPGYLTLSATGSAAEWVRTNLAVRQTVSIDLTRASPNRLDLLRYAIGGGPILIKDGQYFADPEAPAPAEHDQLYPVVAAGLRAGGDELLLVTVDGRQPGLSVGLTRPQLAEYIHHLGCTQAIAFDSGGSVTMVVRPLGESDLSGKSEARIVNSPSDGTERPVANGLFLYSTERVKKARILNITPDKLYLLARSHHPIRVIGLDQYLNPIPLPDEKFRLTITTEGMGQLVGAKFHAGEAAAMGFLEARYKKLKACIPINIIDTLDTIVLGNNYITLEPGERHVFQPVGYDKARNQIPLTHQEVEWKITGGIGLFDSDGTFVASSHKGDGTVVATAGQVSATVAVSVGTTTTLLSRFDQPDEWHFRKALDSVSGSFDIVTSPVHGMNRTAGRLRYDFAGTDVTAAAYLVGEIPISGRPLELGIWVYGDGRDHWLRGVYADRMETRITIDFAREISWTGWKYVRSPLSATTNFPIALERLYIVETDNAKKDSGIILFSELQARYGFAPPPRETFRYAATNNPSWLTFTNQPLQLQSDAFRFFVFGDTKLQRKNPRHVSTEIMQHIISQINQLGGAFVLYTGDLIPRGDLEELHYGKKILDQLDMPYFLALGNHERVGDKDAGNFKQIFGPTHYRFDYRDCSFFVLDNSPGSFHRTTSYQLPSEEQLTWLMQQLEQCQSRYVFLCLHVPVVDPIPIRPTDLNSYEAHLLQTILQAHRERGKRIVVLSGHTHMFSEQVVDGIPYFVSAGGGAALYAPPNQGGFYHFLAFTVQSDQLSCRVVPLFTDITISSPENGHILHPSTTLPLTAEGIFESALPSIRFTVPIEEPISHSWHSSDEQVGWIDPATQTFQARNDGETVITIRSGTAKANARIKVSR